MKTSKQKKEQGITLIALVVTIVVLLILAGITITYVLGEDGIIAQAQLAAQKTKEAEEKELKDFDNITGILSEVVNGKDPDKLEDAITSHKIFANTTRYDEDGNKITEEEPAKTPKITIPADFKIIEGSKDTIDEEGIVIADKDGNEFVWVPCTIDENDGEGKKIDEYKKHEYTEGNEDWKESNYKQYKDWTGDPSQESDNRASVKKYGGFYIARYEAGVPSNASFYVDSTTVNTKPYETSEKNTDAYIPVSKKGMQAWNYIDQTNAKKVSEKMYSGSRSVMSRLVDGIAWDRTVEWIAEDTNLSDKVKKDSTKVGNYANNKENDKITTTEPILWAGHLLNSRWYLATNYRYDNFTSGCTANYNVTNGEGDKYTGYVAGKTYTLYVEMSTGASDNTKLKNIYDLGGNMHEWTTERGKHSEDPDNTISYDNKTYAVLRGGSYGGDGDDRPVSFRYGYRVDSASPNVSFRVILYVK